MLCRHVATEASKMPVTGFLLPAWSIWARSCETSGWCEKQQTRKPSKASTLASRAGKHAVADVAASSSLLIEGTPDGAVKYSNVVLLVVSARNVPRV